MTEKRLYHRMSIEVPVCFETGESKEFVMASTLDISATGLSFKMKQSIQVGEILRMTIGIDENKSINVQAKVVWVKGKLAKEENEYLVGVKIVDKMDQDEMEFVRFIAGKMLEYFKQDKVEDF